MEENILMDHKEPVYRTDTKWPKTEFFIYDLTGEKSLDDVITDASSKDREEAIFGDRLLI